MAKAHRYAMIFFMETNIALHNSDLKSLTNSNQLFVRQRYEIGEWIGFETRNKYEIADIEGKPVAFAAEQQKGIFGFLLRQVFGHWRSFEIHFFSPDRNKVMTANHPFRFYFQRLEVCQPDGQLIGIVQKRFSILTKRFDVQTAEGQVLFEVASPIWRIWNFPFLYMGNEIATVTKKWSGLLTEIFTDKDNFLIEFKSEQLKLSERKLILAAALFIDLQYFERKAGD